MVAGTSDMPNIAIAVSGGGYRVQLNGAGVLAAFDDRTANATSSGHLGGLLQASTYLTALSGGAWLIGSLYSNNFTTVEASTASSNIWQLERTIFDGPSRSLLRSQDYLTDLHDQVEAKKDFGFRTTVTDYWGRALSYQLVNATNGGADYTFSSIATQAWFKQGAVPLSILVADGRAPGETILSTNSTIFEFNLWEIGSFDPTTYAFAPTKYIGTNYTNGKLAGQCTTGFDNIGFLMGTSSSLFNAILTTVNSTNTTNAFTKTFQKALTRILEEWSDANTDIASYPNPFYQSKGTHLISRSRQLTLVDGGEDGQNIPIVPLIQPVRKVDVIFAIDSSADTTEDSPSVGSASNWPNGVSLLRSYERSRHAISNGTVFPSVPDLHTFINLGIADKPSFFGCNTPNSTSQTPLVVYLPNGPYSYLSNTSTFKMQYSNYERNAIITNAYNMATQGNGTLRAGWAGCVSCAILSRSLERTKTTVPPYCLRCFQQYCWNGTLDTHTPAAYQPTPKLPSQVTSTSVGAKSATMTCSIWTLSLLSVWSIYTLFS